MLGKNNFPGLWVDQKYKPNLIQSAIKENFNHFQRCIAVKNYLL